MHRHRRLLAAQAAAACGLLLACLPSVGLHPALPLQPAAWSALAAAWHARPLLRVGGRTVIAGLLPWHTLGDTLRLLTWQALVCRWWLLTWQGRTPLCWSPAWTSGRWGSSPARWVPRSRGWLPSPESFSSQLQFQLTSEVPAASLPDPLPLATLRPHWVQMVTGQRFYLGLSDKEVVAALLGHGLLPSGDDGAAGCWRKRCLLPGMPPGLLAGWLACGCSTLATPGFCL